MTFFKNARFSIAFDAVKAAYNSRKKSDLSEGEAPRLGAKIEREGSLAFSDKHLATFREMVSWKREEIPPTYPYVLLTHLHFSLVNDARFPFPPLGLIHKRETIECLRPLARGSWKMKCALDSIVSVERGYEIKIISELRIDGTLAWRSTTTAFKKTGGGKSGKTHESQNAAGTVFWKVPHGNGRRYAALSNNIDPIHMAKWSARLMGHPGAIMHGMWTAARGLSEFGDFRYPMTVAFKFIAPVFMPAEVMYERNALGFGVYSKDGKTIHLLAEVAIKTP